MKAIDIDGYSLSALAKVLGRAKSGLHKLAQTGQIPKQSNGRFNLAAVQNALDRNLEPSRRKRVHRQDGERAQGEQVNKSAARPVKTPEEAAEAVTMIRRILQEEGAAAGVIDFQAARTAELILKTRERALKMEVESGRLCNVDAVKALVFEFGRENRDAWMNWPGRIAAMVASEIGADAVKTAISLEKYVRAHLMEMADPDAMREKASRRLAPKDGRR